MDAQHPAKRRRLSPDAVHVGNGRPSAANPASFHSPTKASLARFNPNLLPPKSPKEVVIPENRRRNSIPLRPNDDTNGRYTHDGDGTSRRAQSVTTNGSAITKQPSPTRAHSATPRASVSPSKRQSSLPLRRSRTPGRTRPSDSPSRQRPQVAPDPRASPPLAASEARPNSQEVLDAQPEPEPQTSTPSEGQNVTPTARPSNQAPRTQPNGEPDLPLSPAQLGLEPVPEAPKGILFSSPRRLRRRKAGVKSSPLKPADTPLGWDAGKAPGVVEGESLVQVGDSQTQATQRGSQTQTRDIQAHPQEPDLSQQRLLVERLQTQIGAINDDISTMENAIRRYQDPESQPQATQEWIAKLLSILTSKNPTHLPPDPPPPPSPPLSIRLAAFLPFAKPRTPPRSPSPTPPTLPPILGHHPLPLADPLPHLQAFTPLIVSLSPPTLLASESQSYTQSLTHSPAPVLSAPSVLLSKSLNLSSPSSILSVCLDLSIRMRKDTENIESLTLNNISEWADPELGTWIRDMSSTCDVSCIGWGAGRYYEVVHNRAQFWAWCEDEFADFAPQEPHGSEKILASKRKWKQTSPNHGLSAQGDDRAATEDPSLSLTDLQRLIPAHSLTLISPQSSASLLFSWRVSLSTIGEPETRISVCASLPRSWAKVDERRSLEKIDELFQKLLEEYGVKPATTVLVRLVLGEVVRDQGSGGAREGGEDDMMIVEEHGREVEPAEGTGFEEEVEGT